MMGGERTEGEGKGGDRRGGEGEERERKGGGKGKGREKGRWLPLTQIPGSAPVVHYRC